MLRYDDVAMALWLPLLLLAARPVQYADLPAALREALSIREAGFPELIRSIEQRTAERLREGESDHRIYYLLQSQRFTTAPRIEPALSAREFHDNGEKIPRAVARRIQDYLISTPKMSQPQLEAEYARAMRFLYRKEFASQFPAGLYQERGLSADASIEANFAVSEALAVLKALDRRPLQSILIVGPGLDFAPRTGMLDAEPRSYQPYAVAAAIARPRIQVIDVNPRVVAYWARPPREVRVRSIVRDPTPELAAWLRQLAPGGLLRASGKVTAERMNIVTHRGEARYDLVIATNVLTYFNSTDLGLALANIRAMLREGGWLVHNEARAEVETLGRAAGLEPVQARTVRLSRGGEKPLVDAFVLNRATR